MGVEVKYDRAIIVQFASKLYAQARSIVLGYTVLGFLLGAVVALFVFKLMGVSGAGIGELMVAAVPGMYLGYRLGTERAFALRLQAQVALCQAEIEANTRASLVALGHVRSTHDGVRGDAQA
jgi:hypothetical protein